MTALHQRLARLSERELDWCLRLQRRSRMRPLRGLFAVVSRLGNGVFWYALMLSLLVVDGLAAAPTVTRMAVTSVLCLLVYKWLKGKTTRSRPCARHPGIDALVAPLDEYSFPSGHTLHAAGFTITALHGYPGLAWLLIPFAGLVALSRPVLGLHYPSDVLAGALLGAALALLVLQF